MHACSRAGQQAGWQVCGELCQLVGMQVCGELCWLAGMSTVSYAGHAACMHGEINKAYGTNKHGNIHNNE